MTLQQDEKTQQSNGSSKDEKVEYFLVKAAELFAQKGYSQCSVDELAAHLGLSKGGLYWHFSSKEELYSRICTKFCTDHQKLFQGLMQQGELSVDSAVGAGTILMESMLENSIQVSLFADFSVHSRELPKVKEALKKLDLQWELILTGLGENLKKTGILDETADIARTARWCVVFFEGLLFQYIIFGDRERVLHDWQIFLRSILSA